MPRKYDRTEKHNYINQGLVCAGPECDREARIHRLCVSHYMQTRRGNELKPLNAALTREGTN